MTIIDIIAQYSTVIGWVFGLIGLVFMLYMKSKFVPIEQHNDLRKEFDIAVRRVDHIETKVAQLPDTAAIHNLIIQITRLEGELKSVMTRFEGVDGIAELLQTQVNRIEDFLKNKT